MINPSLILAHDLGTTGNKATLYDREGILIGSAFAGYDTIYAQAGQYSSAEAVIIDAQLVGDLSTAAGVISESNLVGEVTHRRYAGPISYFRVRLQQGEKDVEILAPADAAQVGVASGLERSEPGGAECSWPPRSRSTGRHPR